MGIEEILQDLHIDGWSVLEGVIPTDEVGTVRAEAKTVTAAHGVSRTYQGLHSARGILSQVSSFLPYLSDGRVLGVATR